MRTQTATSSFFCTTFGTLPKNDGRALIKVLIAKGVNLFYLINSYLIETFNYIFQNSFQKNHNFFVFYSIPYYILLEVYNVISILFYSNRFDWISFYHKSSCVWDNNLICILSHQKRRDLWVYRTCFV